MDYSAGLDLIPDDRLREVVPAQVAAALPAGVRGFMVSDDASDTAAFVAKYGVPMEDCANTIVVRYRKAGLEHYAAVVTLGSRRIDVNGALKATLQAQRISFANREFVVENSGMEYGGVTVFGLPSTWAVVVDEAVMTRTQVVMGAGIRAAKLLLDPGLLRALRDVNVSSIAA